MTDEVVRFSTKDILNYFMNLLNPEVFETIEEGTKRELIAAANDLARIGRDIQDTISPQTDLLLRNLANPGASPGTPPPKTEPQKLGVFNLVKEFVDKYLPSMHLQSEKLQRELDKLVNRLDEITEYGKAVMDYTGLEGLSRDIEKFDNNDVQPFRNLKEELTVRVEPLREKVGGIIGRKIHPEEAHAEIPVEAQKTGLAPHA